MASVTVTAIGLAKASPFSREKAQPLLPIVSRDDECPVSDNFNFTRKGWQGHTKRRTTIRLVCSSSSSSSNQTKIGSTSSSGLYSAQQFDLTVSNVDMVLEDVRPYLIADGGNVDVVSVQDGIVSLKLQGACESCPSSTTTMKMGIERVLKEKFGDSLKEIRQIYDEQAKETTVEAVDRHLDILRPAIKSLGGAVEVLSVSEGECLVKYEGPESIGSGIKAAIKEKFPDIVNVAIVMSHNV